MLDDGLTLEVLRVCTDGTRNANSMLYSRVKKIAQVMGYKKVLTYTLTEESGASLRAVGAKKEGIVKAREWSRKKRERQYQEVYAKEKVRWML
jgi:phenylalanyl-tRNA synthetase beta subunit